MAKMFIYLYRKIIDRRFHAWIS